VPWSKLVVYFYNLPVPWSKLVVYFYNLPVFLDMQMSNYLQLIHDTASQ